MKPELFYRRLVIALPKVSYQDGWGEEAFFQAKVKKSNDSPKLKKRDKDMGVIGKYSLMFYPAWKIVKRMGDNRNGF